VIVLDASALIAQLDKTDPHHERARTLLIDSPDQPLAASVITLAEAFVAPARRGRLGEAQSAVRELGVLAVELGTAAAVSLALLRAETGLRMPDCCVLHAAATADAETIATFDQRLASAARARGIKTP
jgi:predicted nucleic acid-binding protein